MNGSIPTFSFPFPYSHFLGFPHSHFWDSQNPTFPFGIPTFHIPTFWAFRGSNTHPQSHPLHSNALTTQPKELNITMIVTNVPI